MLLKACIVCFKGFSKDLLDGQESTAVTISHIDKAVPPVISLTRDTRPVAASNSQPQLRLNPLLVRPHSVSEQQV